MPDLDSVPATQADAGRSCWPLLLSPREIRGRRIRNRIVSTPHATGWRLYLEWLAGELHSHGVDVRLGRAGDANDIAALDPDIVILATGSQPRRAGWPDNCHGLVADADEVIVSPPEPRGSASAIVVDQEGGFTAPTAAESLRHAGWTVQVITDLPFVAARVDPTQVWFVRRRLKQAEVTLRGNSELRHDPDGWALVDTESDEISPISAPDLIVYADLRSARDNLSRTLAETLPQVPVHRVGDALAPRGLLDAVTEGARAGMSASSTPAESRAATG